jgi:hypothetical protein
VSPGPKASRQAEAVRTRLLNEVNERRSPRTNATVNQLLDKYLDIFDGDRGTLQKYHGYVRKHIAPFIGQVKVGELDADILDSLYAELRRCRVHCDGRKRIDHRTPVDPHLRPSLPAARVPAARCDDDPPHALHPVRRLQARGALAVGRGQLRRPGRATGGTGT